RPRPAMAQPDLDLAGLDRLEGEAFEHRFVLPPEPRFFPSRTWTRNRRRPDSHSRHARACPEHPRLAVPPRGKIAPQRGRMLCRWQANSWTVGPLPWQGHAWPTMTRERRCLTGMDRTLAWSGTNLIILHCTITLAKLLG